MVPMLPVSPTKRQVPLERVLPTKIFGIMSSYGIVRVRVHCNRS